MLLDALYYLGYGLVDTALEVHGVGTCGDVLDTYVDDALCEYGSCGGTVTGIVAGLRCYRLDELCAGVHEGIGQLHLLGYGYTVLGDVGSTELLLDYHVAAFGAESYFHCVGKLVDTLLELFAGFHIEYDFFCHSSLLF